MKQNRKVATIIIWRHAWYVISLLFYDVKDDENHDVTTITFEIARQRWTAWPPEPIKPPVCDVHASVGWKSPRRQHVRLLRIQLLRISQPLRVSSNMSVTMQKPLDNGRRDITAGQPALTEDEFRNLEASDLLIYNDSEYQYHQQMRVNWEFFYNDVYYLDKEVKKLMVAQQLAFCERNRAERDQVHIFCLIS